jgi:Spy/CpxP family protein refolding chaperone
MVKNGLKHLRDNPGDNSYMAMDNIEDLQRFIDKMEDLVQQAREQGSPDDASARRDLVRRRPVTVVVPGKNSVM